MNSFFIRMQVYLSFNKICIFSIKNDNNEMKRKRLSTGCMSMGDLLKSFGTLKHEMK